MRIALIKAGGVGNRMKANVPKQFIAINGKPIIIYTLESFQRHPSIDEIAVVCVDGWHDILWAYAKQYNITKLTTVVSGGATSLKSIRNGIDALRQRCDDKDIIVIHDGNRPMISQEIISDVLANCEKFGSAVAAIPCTDEVMETDGESMSSTVFLDHKKLYRIQTPDAYRLEILKELFDKVTEEQLVTLGATNTLMIASGHEVHFAQGSELNIRLTTQEDIELCKALLILKEE